MSAARCLLGALSTKQRRARRLGRRDAVGVMASGAAGVARAYCRDRLACVCKASRAAQHVAMIVTRDGGHVREQRPHAPRLVCRNFE